MVLVGLRYVFNIIKEEGGSSSFSFPAPISFFICYKVKPPTSELNVRCGKKGPFIITISSYIWMMYPLPETESA